MKIYFLLTVLGLSFGVVLPFLFSAPSDLVVTGGDAVPMIQLPN
jgi:hypothetical protein